MKNLKHVWYIAMNMLRLFVTDRTAVIMFILFPFLFIVMFNILLSNVGTEDKRLELHMATRENVGISQMIIQGILTADPAQLPPGAPLIVWDKDYDQARADVASGKLGGFLAFPADFTANIQSDKNTNLEIVARAEDTNIRMALNGLAQSIASQLAAQKVELHSVAALLGQQGQSQAEIQGALAKIMQDEASSSGSQALIAFAPPQNIGEAKAMNASSYVVPGYLVMFVFFAAAIESVAIIRERRNHTLERLMASSVKKESLLGGIFLGGVLRGLVQIAIFWTFGILVFKVDIGVAPWAVIVLSLLTVLMASGFALMLSTIAKTERSASALAVLCSLLLAPLGGCWWPLFIDPKWMQFLAKFTPHGWANSGFDKLLVFGASGGDVMWEMLVLVGFAAAFIIIAVLNFRTAADAT
jgi:ABC-2 type transport system permease protein